MKKNAVKFKKRKSKLKILLYGLLSLVVLFVLLILFFFHNEILTIASISEIGDTPSYEINYHGDYSFDKYLEIGADSERTLVKFLTENMAHGVGQLITEDHGCSAFFATTPEGDLIFARNLDTPIAIPAVLETNSRNGYKSISMANLSYGGWDENTYDQGFIKKLSALIMPYATMDGMNEYGLTVAGFTASGSRSVIQEDKITLYDQTVLRLMLDKAKNVDEAIQLLEQYNVCLESSWPSQYMIADAKGNSAVIEYVKGELQVIYKEGNYQIVSNFILYNNPEMLGFGKDRYQAYEEVLSESEGIISSEDAIKLLEENTIPGDEQWSVVYNLTKKTIDLVFYEDYSKVHHYTVD